MVPVHHECREAIRRHAEYGRARRELLVSTALRNNPRVPWTELDDPELAARVHPSLLRFARRHDPDVHGSALLLGPSGCGKTLATNALLFRLAATARGDRSGQAVEGLARSLWTTAHELTRARREHQLGRGEAQLVDRARYASVLFLDEIGFEPSDTIIFDLIDWRYAKRRPTIATSGLRRADFALKYGDAMFRRLIGEGSGTLIDVHGGAA
jgi:DNA replication protein DnaC